MNKHSNRNIVCSCDECHPELHYGQPDEPITISIDYADIAAQEIITLLQPHNFDSFDFARYVKKVSQIIRFRAGTIPK